MTRAIRILVVVVTALLFQVTVFPKLLADPFQPDLMIIIVVQLGLRWSIVTGAPAAFGLGLLQDCFSGTSFGLNGFSYLMVFFILNRLADRLYTDNLLLNVLAVFTASVLQGLSHLFLLLLFSADSGTYVSLLPSLLPHSAMNAAASFIITRVGWGLACREAA
jgi:rod shape-determining protein MreD